MPLHMFPPLPAECAIESLMMEPCSPAVPAPPWEGIAARVPEAIRADSDADLQALHVPCFLTIARMISGPSSDSLMVQFVDPRTGRVSETPIQPVTDNLAPRPPSRPGPPQPPAPIAAFHDVSWRSLDLTAFYHFHSGVYRFRFRIGQLYSPEYQVTILVRHPDAP